MPHSEETKREGKRVYTELLTELQKMHPGMSVNDLRLDIADLADFCLEVPEIVRREVKRLARENT